MSLDVFIKNTEKHSIDSKQIYQVQISETERILHFIYSM